LENRDRLVVVAGGTGMADLAIAGADHVGLE
jgi:hypothetical protein